MYVYLPFPEPLLRQYCRKVGISFHENMLNWNASPEDLKVFQGFQSHCFSAVTKSNGFRESKRATVLSDVPPDVREAIRDSMPYYNKMHMDRMKLST